MSFGTKGALEAFGCTGERSSDLQRHKARSVESGPGALPARVSAKARHVSPGGDVLAWEPPSSLQAQEGRAAGSFKQLDLTNGSCLKS